MNRIIKVLFVICNLFIIRLVIGCNGCNISTQLFTINNIKIQKIDNSGRNPQYDPDTICRSALAFELVLSDNQIVNNSSGDFSGVFSEILASDQDCSPNYISDKLIDSISILSINRINYNYPPKSNVSNLFYADLDYIPDNLYVSLYELADNFNKTDFFTSPEYRFYVFLKIPIEFNSAAFTFTVYFSDNTNISYSTGDFFLKDCY